MKPPLALRLAPLALLLAAPALAQAPAGGPLPPPASRPQPPAVLRLWAGAAPGETGAVPPEQSQATDPGKILPHQTVNVSVPTLTTFRPARDVDTGVSVIVCPGGGFRELEMDKEGEMAARWLNSVGITAFVLKYRVPDRPGTPRLAATQDAQRAMRLVRSHAPEWGLDPRRVGIMGFSAGAALSVFTCVRAGQDSYPPADAADRASSRPDFAVVVYPGEMVDKATGVFRSDLPVSKATPQMFIVDVENDRVNSDNSTFLFLALKHAGVPAELHQYTLGQHGFAFRPGPNPHTTWPDRLRDWMVGQG
ncbi:MAG TPA: alpha/beta hydrolase, partial [Opitutaceae bacterium]|nr:alpha/beta hydrolase [Opitutaceae bacterium]